MSNLLAPVARPSGKAATPWVTRSSKEKLAIVLATVLPMALGLGYWYATGMEFIAVLIVVFLPLQLIAGGLAGFASQGRRGISEGLLVVVTIFLSTFVLVMLLSILYSVFFFGLQAMSPHFLYQNNRYVGPLTDLSIGGVGHALLGTFMIVTISTIITVPLGVASAVYITETQGRSRGLTQMLFQAMSGLPSVVAGLFIYSMLIFTGVLGYSGIAGALALVPLMLPTVARVAEEALRLVPKELRNGALALGAPAWKAFFMVTLPAAKSGIITAVLLGIARIIGETAPLVLTIFASNTTNWNPFQDGMASLPTYVFQALGLSTDFTIARAWGAALTIILSVGVVFSLARIISSPKKAKK
ncbi:MAG: phosphate transporter permease PstA [Actinomycetota bacterium]|jgi:phosphate transport system permease protein